MCVRKVWKGRVQACAGADARTSQPRRCSAARYCLVLRSVRYLPKRAFVWCRGAGGQVGRRVLHSSVRGSAGRRVGVCVRVVCVCCRHRRRGSGAGRSAQSHRSQVPVPAPRHVMGARQEGRSEEGAGEALQRGGVEGALYSAVLQSSAREFREMLHVVQLYEVLEVLHTGRHFEWRKAAWQVGQRQRCVKEV